MDLFQRPQAKRDRPEILVPCIGLVGASARRGIAAVVCSSDEVGTKAHTVKPIWRKNHGGAQIVALIAASA